MSEILIIIVVQASDSDFQEVFISSGSSESTDKYVCLFGFLFSLVLFFS